ncbi:hypothetical protein BF49_2569 [Bradyrhizobium sp.]|nr:hypothetical protein BF49_2569 [Bradyrhizobium sp.]
MSISSLRGCHGLQALQQPHNVFIDARRGREQFLEFTSARPSFGACACACVGIRDRPATARRRL